MELSHSGSSALPWHKYSCFPRFIQEFDDTIFFVLGVHIDSTMHLVTSLIPKSMTIGACEFVCIYLCTIIHNELFFYG